MPRKMPACVYCAKEYKQRTLLTRHERVCGVTHRGRSRDDDEALPSQRDLYEVVLHLLDKVGRLEEKVGRLTTQERRAWSLEEALGGAVPTQSFREWSKSLVATPQHIEHVFERGHAEGLVRMVKELLGAPSPDLPLRAFQQRKDTVYAYGADGKWEKLETGDWELFLKTLDKTLYVQFIRWQQAAVTQMSEAAFQDTYSANLNRMSGSSGHGEATKVKRAVYQAFVDAPFCGS